jgi:hypothetical protein
MDAFFFAVAGATKRSARAHAAVLASELGYQGAP